MDYQRDIKQNKNSEKNIEKFENKLVFNNNDRYRFVFKKHERLVAALYLITNLFSDSEPLKWKIRESALEALDQSLELTNTTLEDRTRIVARCGSAISELVALCQIAYISKYISEMNHTILTREFAGLLENLEAINYGTTVQGSAVLSSEFFSVPESLFPKKTITDNKGLSNTVADSTTSNNQAQSNVFNIRDTVKESRRDTIIAMLRNNKTLAVKDFAQEIKDCSEKTIQRELLTLVDEGVLNKIGERRWSVYSLRN